MRATKFGTIRPGAWLLAASMLSISPGCGGLFIVPIFSSQPDDQLQRKLTRKGGTWDIVRMELELYAYGGASAAPNTFLDGITEDDAGSFYFARSESPPGEGAAYTYREGSWTLKDGTVVDLHWDAAGVAGADAVSLGLVIHGDAHFFPARDTEYWADVTELDDLIILDFYDLSDSVITGYFELRRR